MGATMQWVPVLRLSLCVQAYIYVIMCNAHVNLKEKKARKDTYIKTYAHN